MSDRIGLARCRVHFLVRKVADRESLISIINHWSEAMKHILYRMSVVHRKLDDQIKQEAKRRWPDTLRLAHLKKLRLALKDRIVGHVKVPAFRTQS